MNKDNRYDDWYIPEEFDIALKDDKEVKRGNELFKKSLVTKFESLNKDKATDVANINTIRNEEGYAVLTKEEWNEEY